MTTFEWTQEWSSCRGLTVVSKNEEIAYLFNTYFNDITKGLNIERWPISNLRCKDPLVSAIRKYEMPPPVYLKSNQSLSQ